MSVLTDALADLLPHVVNRYDTPGASRAAATFADFPREHALFEQPAHARWRQILSVARLRRALPRLLEQFERDLRDDSNLDVLAGYVASIATVRAALADDDGTGDVLGPGTERLPEDPAPSQRLDARHEVVPWHGGGREEVLAALEAWAAEPARASVWLIHAEGGVGKTRVAIEWSWRLRERRREREPAWCAGFLAKDAPEGWYDDLCAWGVSTLVVVDYAESRPELLGALRRLLKAHKEGGSPTLRVLLLARNDGDWWAQLAADRELGPWLKARAPLALAPVAEAVADREGVFREAVAAFARGRREAPTPPEAPRFDDARFERVLYLHMAALAHVEGIGVPVGRLMDVILDHEERFWERRGREGDDAIDVSLHRAQARQLVAAATLRGGFATPDDARAVAKRMADRALDRDDERLLVLLHRVYQRGAGVWQAPLEPDLLGEAMVVRVAASERAEEAAPADWIDRVFPDDNDAELRTGFTVLGRASVAAPAVVVPWIRRLLAAGDIHVRAPAALEAAKEVARHSALSPLGDLIANHLERHGDVQVAVKLDQIGIPLPTVSLSHLAEWVSGIIWRAMDRFPEGLPPEERARQMAAHAVRLFSVGAVDEPLELIGRAVGMTRALWREDPQHALELAMNLNNLAIMHLAAGDPQGAYAAVREAEQLYLEIISNNPGGHQDELAYTRHNLGEALAQLGEHSRAIAATRDAVQLRQELAGTNPAKYLPLLGSSLTSLSGHHSKAGDLQEALEALEAAAVIYRRWALASADSATPALALFSDNCSNILSDLGLLERAAQTGAEAIRLYGELAFRWPAAYRKHLARSQYNRSIILARLGRTGEALKMSLEAVRTRRSLFTQKQQANAVDLAYALNGHANRLAEAEYTAQALDCICEALEVIWPYFEGLPKAHAELVAKIMLNCRNLYDGTEAAPPPHVMKMGYQFIELMGPTTSS
jgi:hypothetical protein